MSLLSDIDTGEPVSAQQAQQDEAAQHAQHATSPQQPGVSSQIIRPTPVVPASQQRPALLHPQHAAQQGAQGETLPRSAWC